MRVAVVNRFYPPDAAITGVSAAELVAALVERLPHAEFRVFASAARYAGGIQRGDIGPVTVDRISSARLPGGKLGRLANSLAEGRALARRAVAWADVVISLTDPPLLGYWIGREIARHGRRVRWLEWTMDLYPEAFVSAGLVGERNLLYRYLLMSLRRHLPDAYLCLGPAQAAAVSTWRDTDVHGFLLPCGIVDGAPALASAPPSWRNDDGRVVFAYAGNIGEAHCPNLLEALVNAADPARFLFVFALYGTHRPRLEARLADRPNIVWADHLSHAELAHADVHIASLRAEWTHVCVPSKAVSTICLGRPLLFSGDRAGDTASMLGDAAWLIDIPSDGRYDVMTIRALLERIGDRDELQYRGCRALYLARHLPIQKESTFDAFAAWLDDASDVQRLERAA